MDIRSWQLALSILHNVYVRWTAKGSNRHRQWDWYTRARQVWTVMCMQ